MKCLGCAYNFLLRYMRYMRYTLIKDWYKFTYMCVTHVTHVTHLHLTVNYVTTSVTHM